MKCKIRFTLTKMYFPMPQFIHFKNKIGLDDLILSSSPKKKKEKKTKYVLSYINHSK